MATTTTATDPFKETIQAHLESVAKNDTLFAETLKKPNKSIDECINYIYQEVRKTGRCGWNDEEIFRMAIHYYDEDDIKDIKPVNNVRAEHKKETPAPSKPVEKTPQAVAKNTSKKVTTNELGQISLFD